eukprot:11162338-Lingulodinium_polyedra.AAC.1
MLKGVITRWSKDQALCEVEAGGRGGPACRQMLAWGRLQGLRGLSCAGWRRVSWSSAIARTRASSQAQG